MRWGEKPYYSLDYYLKEKFGEKVYKIALDGGMTCPNRDGTLDTRGYIFCSSGGSGDFAVHKKTSVTEQINDAITLLKSHDKKTGSKYIAYFQSYSNTYAPLSRLASLYSEALSHPSVVGLVIGTRPDCVDEEKLDWLAGLRTGKVLPGWRRDGFDRPVVKVEYGIESCHDRTLERVGRGHGVEVAVQAVKMSAERGLEPGAHFILGLPGETREMLIDQCGFISSMPLHSVKFHQLQIVKGTRIEQEYSAHPEDFYMPELPEYLDLVCDILERLRPDLLIERVAGEVPPRFVRETKWGLIRNFQILHMLDDMLEERDTWQGRLF